jgi:hypothetical protein
MPGSTRSRHQHCECGRRLGPRSGVLSTPPQAAPDGARRTRLAAVADGHQWHRSARLAALRPMPAGRHCFPLAVPIAMGGRNASAGERGSYAQCVPAAVTGGYGPAAKLHVSGPTRQRGYAPSQGGSAGSNPVGATNQHQHNTAADQQQRRSAAVLCVRPGPAGSGCRPVSVPYSCPRCVALSAAARASKALCAYGVSSGIWLRSRDGHDLWSGSVGEGCLAVTRPRGRVLTDGRAAPTLEEGWPWPSCSMC